MDPDAVGESDSELEDWEAADAEAAEAEEAEAAEAAEAEEADARDDVTASANVVSDGEKEDKHEIPGRPELMLLTDGGEYGSCLCRFSSKRCSSLDGPDEGKCGISAGPVERVGSKPRIVHLRPDRAPNSTTVWNVRCVECLKNCLAGVSAREVDVDKLGLSELGPVAVP